MTTSSTVMGYRQSTSSRWGIYATQLVASQWITENVNFSHLQRNQTPHGFEKRGFPGSIGTHNSHLGAVGNDEIHILQDNLAIVQDCYMPDFHPGWIFGYGLLFFHELLSNSSGSIAL
jgi:hypothetical protein